jgi:hypothetical protein
VILIAFVIGLAAIVAATVVLVVRGLRLWRSTKSTGRRLSAELATFEERTARTELLLTENETASRELQEALERLRASQAQLAVLTGALERATARTRWLRAFLPV